MLTIATSPGFLHLKLELRFYILFHSEWNLRPAALNKQKLEEKSCLCGLFDALVAHENKHFLGRTVDVTWNLLGSALVWFPSHKFWNHLAASFYWQLADRKNLVTLFVIYSVLTLYYFWKTEWRHLSTVEFLLFWIISAVPNNSCSALTNHWDLIREIWKVKSGYGPIWLPQTFVFHHAPLSGHVY